ncbi:metal-dependent hydrolase family protein [Mariniblastus fucicola]|uniref:Imidazolonepropionase n=1 Tax=Mariniblastus fucicola TaxID=980251 RepID=A0A5B9PH91_9BACT|nr:amidohydrolase family protein [Mariniblastus fucicola]QEG24979.1 imidazolonepropionase [Mariniblastus fucicola]
MIRTILVVVALLFLQAVGSAQTVIHAGKLINGKDGKVHDEMTIVIGKGKIAAVEEGYLDPTDDLVTVIDLKDHTVMPGLMDMHTHLMMQHHKKIYSDKFFMNDADFALRSTTYAKKTLLAGFTTVRELGDNGTNSVSLRKAIDNGWIVGPRIFTAGKSLATTGGHADPTNGMKGSFKRDGTPVDGVVNGVDDARKAVRQRYKDGADLIKLTATGGVLSLAVNGQNPQFTKDELEAIVEIAKDYEMTVAVHAHGTEGMKRAVLAGVNSIEHGTYMTPEVMELMKERGTYYVPTLMAGDWVAMKAKEDDYFPAVVRPKAAAIGPVIMKTFAKAHASGVRIAFGTDSGVSPHGENAREFELMVAGGMTPMQAIQSATLEASKLLRIEDRLGTIEKGKLADIVAVKGDPIENISLMKNVAFVMKEGTVFKDE